MAPTAATMVEPMPISAMAISIPAVISMPAGSTSEAAARAFWSAASGLPGTPDAPGRPIRAQIDAAREKMQEILSFHWNRRQFAGPVPRVAVPP